MLKLDKKFFVKIGVYGLSVLAYGILYYAIIGPENFHFSSKLNTSDTANLYDLVYFSAITQSTVGYGDVYPRTAAGKFFVMTQLLVPFLVILS